MKTTALEGAFDGVEEISGEEAFAEISKLCTARAGIYRLLSRLYRIELDEAGLDELRSAKFPASTGNEKVDAGYRLIAKYLSNVWESTLTELAIDYARVFIGHGIDAFSAAYPYESVYVSEKRLLMQAARDEVVAIYRAAGLDKCETWKEGEDHVALELEFMQVLCTRTVGALERGDECEAMRLLGNQRSFLGNHLASWVPMMTSDMRKFAKTGLYLGLADLTDGFLESELAFLDDVLREED